MVKEALITAAAYWNSGRHPNFAVTYTNTRGIIFLGTPHRGSEKASLAKVLANIASLHRPNKKLVRGLQQNSHILQKQRDDFVTISKKISIVCVREEIPMFPIGMVRPLLSVIVVLC